MLDISEKLKTLRKKNKLTIQTVADGIGIAVRTYQNYEYGQREISVETLDRLADFYGVTTDYLLGRDGAAPPPDPVDTVARELKMQEMERLVMDEYFKLPEHLRHEVTEFLERLVSGG